MKPVPDGALVDDLRLREIVAVPRGVYGIDERERLLLEEMQLIARALLELRMEAREVCADDANECVARLRALLPEEGK